MSCVNPPLLKKPSRGFAWACGPCSKAQEKKLEARNTPNVTDPMVDAEEEEYVERATLPKILVMLLTLVELVPQSRAKQRYPFTLAQPNKFTRPVCGSFGILASTAKSKTP
jgi:hypothetical protein